MWSLNLDKVRSLVPEELGSLAIESGTCRGNGTRALAKQFSRVISIELQPHLHLAAKARLDAEGLKHVECMEGNSAQILEAVLAEIKEDRVFFFLDAHWSGDDSVDWLESGWKGYGLNTAHLGKSGSIPDPEQQCPLADELSAIVNNFSGRAVLLIDDMKNIPLKGPGLKDHTFKGEDWSHLSRDRLLSILNPRLKCLYELKDPEQWLVVLNGAPAY